jgi:RPA family protein
MKDKFIACAMARAIRDMLATLGDDEIKDCWQYAQAARALKRYDAKGAAIEEGTAEALMEMKAIARDGEGMTQAQLLRMIRLSRGGKG